jgi:peptidoglycan hydrolase FlgJ
LSTAPLGAGLAADGRSIDALRAKAASDPKAAVREAAKQFEALFMQQLLKSMRQATMTSGMLDNETSRLGTEMLDSQLATKMTGLPGGLADAIARQLERQIGAVTGQVPPRLTLAEPVAAAKPTDTPRIPSRSAAEFIQQHDATAQSVARESGIPAAFMLGQAAHESGWGRREILNADGSSSHNLFGIKAGAGWTGPVAEVTTTEYVDGKPQKTVARFRAYGSHEESFRDYARLMQQSPRYAGVVAGLSQASGNVAEFAQGLQKAGYATDPAYAEKLTRVINTTLRLQRAAGAA